MEVMPVGALPDSARLSAGRLSLMINLPRGNPLLYNALSTTPLDHSRPGRPTPSGTTPLPPFLSVLYNSRSLVSVAASEREERRREGERRGDKWEKRTKRGGKGEGGGGEASKRVSKGKAASSFSSQQTSQPRMEEEGPSRSIPDWVRRGEWEASEGRGKPEEKEVFLGSSGWREKARERPKLGCRSKQCPEYAQEACTQHAPKRNGHGEKKARATPEGRSADISFWLLCHSSRNLLLLRPMQTSPRESGDTSRKKYCPELNLQG